MSLLSPGYTGTPFLNQVGPKLTAPLTSVSQVLGLKEFHNAFQVGMGIEDQDSL